MTSPPDPRRPYRPAPTSGGYLEAEESRRQLTAAHIALKRGNFSEAERSVLEVIARLPQDSSAQEMLGDIRFARDDYEGALEAYRASLEREPGKVTTENKIGRVTLRISENNRRQSLGVSYASEERSLLQTRGAQDPSRKKRLIWFTVILPGLGHIFAGDFVKGGILLAIFALGTLMVGLAGIHTPFGVVAVFGLVISTIDWIYAMVDIARDQNSY